MDPAVLSRQVNVGFSGGERKLCEVLQLACLEPELAILDEVDSGLDIDALHAVAHAVQGMRVLRPQMGLLIITHYKARYTERQQHLRLLCQQLCGPPSSRNPLSLCVGVAPDAM
ncbi:hypothetical protein ABPG77_005453 [Micractinium sp. CCAP 211/92]